MPTKASIIKDFQLLTDADQKDVTDVILSILRSDVDVKKMTAYSRSVDRICPSCGNIHVVKNGKNSAGTQTFVCRACGHYFIASSGTAIFKTTHPSYTWSRFIDDTLNGDSLRRCAKDCRIALNTAFNWRHKVLDALAIILKETSEFTGVTECDETFFSISYKGISKYETLPREKNKRGTPAKKRGLLIFAIAEAFAFSN